MRPKRCHSLEMNIPSCDLNTVTYMYIVYLNIVIYETQILS